MASSLFSIMTSLAPNLLVNIWRTIGCLGFVLLFYLSLTPQPPEIPIEQGDKLGHALAYAVLMFWWAQLMRRPTERAVLAAVLLAVGIGIEFLQRWTGWRTFDYYDMLAHAVGIAGGWLLAWPRTPDLIAWFGRSRAGPGSRA